LGLARDSAKAAAYAAGTDALAKHRSDEAVALLSAVVTLDPGNRDAGERLAEALDSDMVHVPEGEFIMGCDCADVDERPQRPVHLDAFEIDRYEVTNIQYQRLLRGSGRDGPRRWAGRYLHLDSDRSPDWRGDEYPSGEAMYPAAGITWEEATEYCAWVGKRLPTEAEWEKAARGTDERAYPWGSTWDPDRANTLDQRLSYPAPVGAYASGASPYGAMDMAGNVWEWASDLYDRRYYSWANDSNPSGPTSGTGERILRGGAWDSSPDQTRTSYRNATHFFGPNFRVGFRCARSLTS
jgi:formylglycine-generating enzyme required for sulfatase activity